MTTDDLTETETAALRDYVRAYGHMWKSELHSRLCSEAGRRSLGPTLVRLADARGFAWLHGFETPSEWYGDDAGEAPPTVPPGGTTTLPYGPPYVPADVNLDAMSPDDLLAFDTTAETTVVMCERGDAEARAALVALCGGTRNGAPRMGVLASLRDYARSKRRAMLARLAGRIDAAMTIERRLDALYQHEISRTKAAW